MDSIVLPETCPENYLQTSLEEYSTYILLLCMDLILLNVNVRNQSTESTDGFYSASRDMPRQLSTNFT